MNLATRRPAVLISDGNSNIDELLTQNTAQYARELGIEIYTIATGDSANHQVQLVPPPALNYGILVQTNAKK